MLSQRDEVARGDHLLLGGDGGGDPALDVRHVDDAHAGALVVGQHVENGLGGEQSGAEVADDHDPGARVRLADARHHLGETGPDPVVVGAAGRDQAHGRRHLAGESDGALREEDAVRDEDDADAVRHPAASAAARSSSAVDWEPGSRCPAERSPR